MIRRAILPATQARVVARARQVLLEGNLPKGIAPTYLDRTTLGLVATLASLLQSNVANIEPLNLEALELLEKAISVPAVRRAATPAILGNLAEAFKLFAQYAETYAELLDTWDEFSDTQRAGFANDFRAMARHRLNPLSDLTEQSKRLGRTLIDITARIIGNHG